MIERKDKLFTVKVKGNLFSAFKHACENQDTVASQAVRAFMNTLRNMDRLIYGSFPKSVQLLIIH
jgi:hypothetical protein